MTASTRYLTLAVFGLIFGIALLTTSTTGQSVILTPTPVIPLLPEATAETNLCINPTPPRLIIGQIGKVTEGAPNNLRSEPALSATKIGSLPAESEFMVLAGPICADGYTWWKVDYHGARGWTVESGEGKYWLIASNINEQIMNHNVGQLRPYATLKLDGKISSVVGGAHLTVSGVMEDGVHTWKLENPLATAGNTTLIESSFVPGDNFRVFYTSNFSIMPIQMLPDRILLRDLVLPVNHPVNVFAASNGMQLMFLLHRTGCRSPPSPTPAKSISGTQRRVDWMNSGI
jgi:hypothetical protein